MEPREFFAAHPRAALAFSGGVDSAYLLYAACACGAQVQPYFVKTPFQPQFELEDACRLTAELGVALRVVELDVLADEAVASNPSDRCYHCKRRIFSAIAQAAEEDGYGLLLDGTNASDSADDRPGTRALKELDVRSPLRLCGLTKQEIRARSREAGLFTWDKPAYACLATRIPTGERITKEWLAVTEAAEAFLTGLGLSDLRVRRVGTTAKLQVPAAQLASVLAHRETILRELKRYYTSVVLDLEVRE